MRNRENCEEKVNIKVVIEVMNLCHGVRCWGWWMAGGVSVQMLLTTFVHIFFPSFLHDSSILSRLLLKISQRFLLKVQFNVNTILDVDSHYRHGYVTYFCIKHHCIRHQIYFLSERTTKRNSLVFQRIWVQTATLDGTSENQSENCRVEKYYNLF
jgi:hypothetical protein